MPREQNQKFKSIAILKLLYRETDEDHPMTGLDIRDRLAAEGIRAERKSIYTDIEALRRLGIDILCRKGPSGGFYVASRIFELAELKLLVDAVQASRFITEKKSIELIKKLEQLASVFEAQTLQRSVFVLNRIKTMNESIYYNIDEIHTAISLDRGISFLYFEYAADKKRSYRRNGSRYRVSPYALTWNNENYYLIGYDETTNSIKHFRVDKMEKIDLEPHERCGKKQFDGFDVAVYANRLFGMFGGETQTVTLRIRNSLAGVMIDRFGTGVYMAQSDYSGWFQARVSVTLSPQFYGWVFSFGRDMEILAPETARNGFRSALVQIHKLYLESTE